MKKSLLTIFLVAIIGGGAFLYSLGYNSSTASIERFKKLNPYRRFNLIKEGLLKISATPSIPPLQPTKKGLSKNNKVLPPQQSKPDSPQEWGVAKQIGEHTYTIKLGGDDRMGTAQEILEALNLYRQNHGTGRLEWSDNLETYSQSRADSFKSSGSTDAHAGLNNFLEKEDGFTKLGFSHVGENSYHGGPLYAVHLIEWLFSSSEGHNANQLDGSWSHVGVGVTDVSVNLIFAGGKW